MLLQIDKQSDDNRRPDSAGENNQHSLNSLRLMNILKNQCEKGDAKLSSLTHNQALELLFAQFLFQYYGKQALLTVDAIDEIIANFGRPEVRTFHANRFHSTLEQTMHHCTQAQSTADLLDRLALNRKEKAQLLELSTLLFTHQLLQPKKNSFSNASAQLHALELAELQILSCANILYTAFLVKPKAESNLLQQAIFQEGLESAFIAEHIAKQFAIAPVQLALCSMVRSINLLLIHEYCQDHSLIQESEDAYKCIDSPQVFIQVHQFISKMDYWLAKDIGLSDNILYVLKHAFVKKEKLPTATKALFLTERCHLLFSLFKHGHLSLEALQLNMLQLGLRPEHFPQVYQSYTQH